jgi:hypothetical protein
LQRLYEVLASVPDSRKRLGSHRLAQGKQTQSTLGLYDLETRHVVAQRALNSTQFETSSFS